MRVMLAIFVAFFIFSTIKSHSNQAIKKVLSIVKDIKKNMINVDDVVNMINVDDVVIALTPIIEGRFVRQNVSSPSLDKSELNNLLGAMKAINNPNDWKSFENVANYHGKPYMCEVHNPPKPGDWNISYPGGIQGYPGAPCCRHHDTEFPYFVAWHRNYIVNFEYSLNRVGSGDSAKIGVPYWDWTELTNTPTGLPVLAENYSNWKNGIIKGSGGEVTTRNPKDYFTNELNIEHLRRHVKLAYCAQNYSEYNTRSQTPHDAVHNNIRGSMQSIIKASYDPIFYLHHSFVDFQYAYWQELQKIRGKSTLAVNPDREMPPFSGYTPPPVNPDIPNPLHSTKEFDTQRLGLDYKNNFNYEYDKLTFNGLTPNQFHEKYAEWCLKQFQVGLTLVDYKISSVNYIYARYSGSGYKVGSYHTLAMTMDPEVGIHHIIETTKFFDDNAITLEGSKTIHYVVKSTDLDDQSIALNLYKPTFEYYDENEQRTIRYHVSYFSDYCPTSFLYGEDVILEFLEDNGSYSTGVTSGGAQVTSPYKLTETKEFQYGGFTIELFFVISIFIFSIK